MQRYIDLARAARLAGITRAELQRLIADHTLSTFEGKVEYRELLALFPEIGSASGMVEIVSQIKEDAVRKPSHSELRGRDSPASLKAERDQLRADLAYYKRQSQHYRQILLELRPKLEKLQQHSEHKHRIQTIINWFVHKTKDLW